MLWRNTLKTEMSDIKQLKIIRLIIGIFLGGVSAFPLEWKLRVLTSWISETTTVGSAFPGLAHWLSYVREGLENADRFYPFLAYGTDWLAVARIGSA
jgi:hypothetical protein